MIVEKEVMLNQSDKNTNETEKNTKELLFDLYYELHCEIKETQLEIPEEMFQDNLRYSTVKQLIGYLRDSIRILVKKKIEETKEEMKTQVVLEKDSMSDNDREQYEYNLRVLERHRRNHVQFAFEKQFKTEALEHKLRELLQMEFEFEEMKEKVKYEAGRFLDNDRKDNELFIIRRENSKIKNTLRNYEKERRDMERKDKEIDMLKREVKGYKERLEIMQKELIMIGKNMNEKGKGNAKEKENNKDNDNDDAKTICDKCIYCNHWKTIQVSSSQSKGNNLIMSRNSKSNSHSKNKEMTMTILEPGINNNEKKKIANESSGKIKKKGLHHRNYSMSTLLDKKQSDFLSKYFSSNQPKQISLKSTTGDSTNNNNNNKLNPSSSSTIQPIPLSIQSNPLLKLHCKKVNPPYLSNPQNKSSYNHFNNNSRLNNYNSNSKAHHHRNHPHHNSNFLNKKNNKSSISYSSLSKFDL